MANFCFNATKKQMAENLSFMIKKNNFFYKKRIPNFPEENK